MPFYVVISYTWDDLSPIKQVYIHNHMYNVTVNQYAAMRRLRLPDRARVLWMDVICVDQADLEEQPDWERTKCDYERLELVANLLGQICLTTIKTPDNDDFGSFQDRHTRLWSWLRALEHAGSNASIAKRTVDVSRGDKSLFDFLATIFRDTTPKQEESGYFIGSRLDGNDWSNILKWWKLLNRCAEGDAEHAYPGATLVQVVVDFLSSTGTFTLAITADHRLCLVPDSSQVGDSLYHIRACQAPLVLRRAGDDDDAGPAVFQVVGPAYIRGLMGSQGWKREEERVIVLK